MSAYTETATIADVATALVAELGEGWSVHEHQRYNYVGAVDGPDEMQIGIRHKRGQYEFRGQHPTRNGQYPRVDGDSGTTKCADTRDPAAIARDVARRLLPIYRDWLYRYQAACASIDEYEARTVANRDAFAARTGIAIRATSPNQFSATGWAAEANGHGIRFAHVITVSVDQAARIVEILNER